jgi:hypothetical protein
VWGFGDLGDSLDGLSPVVGAVLVHRQQTLIGLRGASFVGVRVVMDCQTHYWALRQQARGLTSLGVGAGSEISGFCSACVLGGVGLGG